MPTYPTFPLLFPASLTQAISSSQPRHLNQGCFSSPLQVPKGCAQQDSSLRTDQGFGLITWVPATGDHQGQAKLGGPYSLLQQGHLAVKAASMNIKTQRRAGVDRETWGPAVNNHLAFLF